MRSQKIQLYIALMFAVFPNYVFASLFPRTTYTLSEEEKHIKWLFDSRVFKRDAVDAYYLYGRPWKTTNHYRGRYTACERDHSHNFLCCLRIPQTR